MRYHTPIQSQSGIESIPQFLERNGELVSADAFYSKGEYPNLAHSLVKITTQDGRKIFLPKHKFGMSSQDH